MVEGHIRPPVVVDVREDLRSGRQPLNHILQAAKSVMTGQDLVLLTTFEPIPLYKVLSLRGFTHEAHPLPGGDWEVRFLRRHRRRSTQASQPRRPLLPQPKAEPPGCGWTTVDWSRRNP